MTAINMMVQPKARAGFIISDTAVTDDEGRFVESCGKVALGTGRFPYAIGLTGSVHPVTACRAFGARSLTSLKQLIKWLPHMLKQAIADDASARGHDMPPGALMVRGMAWDFARKRPMGFVMTSDERLLPGAEPFAFYEADWHITKCDGADTLADMLGREANPTDPGSFDPAEDGLKLTIEQYRRGCQSLLPGLEASTPYRIGGEVHLVEVTKRGVTAYRIHDFGDEIGKPIDPQQLSQAQEA